MFVPNTGYYVGVVVVLTTLIGVYCAYVFWAFCVRRVSWVNLRTTQVPMAILVLLTWWLVDMLAAYLTDPIENIVIALGGQPDEVFLGYGPALLALGAALTGVLAAIATSLASAVCGHLQTGVAPHRVRRRHIGGVPGSVVKRLPARTYRLIAADDDSSVANEVRRALADVGMSEVDEDEEGQRQIVVVSDRTPIDLVSDDRLTEPLAVVATSVAVPVRGVLQRFQWVDYRRRRRRTLAALGRDLAGESSGENTLTPPLPESLQKVRLPFWLRVVEWTLFAMATLATIVATYPLVQWAFTDQEPDLWPAPLCIPVAAALVTLTLMVRRRRITPGAVVAVGAVSWLVMSACGLNQVVEAMYPSTNPALSISASWAYALASAIVLVIAWRPLRRWLPRRLRRKEAEQPTLGPAAGSWPWYVAVGPLFLAFLSAAGLSTAPPDSSGNLETAAIDTCRDQTEMAAFLEPLNSANEAVQTANEATIRSAVESRIEAIGRVIDGIERYVPSGSWGADMKTRLIEGLEGMSGADRTYLDQGSVGSEAYEAVGNTVTELNGAVC
jgi:ABC-type multidrug transport system fused ATPase/permease subunit